MYGTTMANLGTLMGAGVRTQGGKGKVKVEKRSEGGEVESEPKRQGSVLGW